MSMSSGKLNLHLHLNKDVLVSIIEKVQKLYGNMLTKVPSIKAIQQIRKIKPFNMQKESPFGLFQIEVDHYEDNMVDVDLFLNISIEDKLILSKIIDAEQKLLKLIAKEEEKLMVG